MSRRKIYDIRNLMHQILETLPKSDRSQIAEYERDLAMNFNCDLWDNRVYAMSSRLRRLIQIPERGVMYNKVMELFAI